MAVPSSDGEDHDGVTSRPTTATLRALIAKTLISDSNLDAFCLDHFRNVYDQFTVGMNRVQKVNLLLEREAPEQVLAALQGIFESRDGADLSVRLESGPLRTVSGRLTDKRGQFRKTLSRFSVATATIFLMVTIWGYSETRYEQGKLLGQFEQEIVTSHPHGTTHRQE